MKLQIPTRLKIEHLERVKSTRQIKGFHNDKVYFICHSIIQQMHKMDDNAYYPGVAFKYYVPLNATILKHTLGNCYLDIIEWMVAAGIILRKDGYTVGKQSKLFRLANRYLWKYRWITTTHRTFHSKNYSDIFCKYTDKFMYEPRLIKRLERRFTELKIDSKKAYALADELCNEERQKILCGPKKFRQKKLEILNVKRDSYNYMIKRISNGEVFIYPDKFGHRLHTPLTGLKREFRPYLTHNGKTLVEIDMSNSQLFLILSLLNYENWKLKKLRRGKISLNSTIWQGIELVYTNSNIIMFLKSLETRYGKGLQNVPFAQDACNGVIYEKLVEELNRVGFFKERPNDMDKRKEVKSSLLKVLFACPHKHKNMFRGKPGQVWKAFGKLYPEVTTLLNMIKAVDYRNASKLLQRIESCCMIRGVCKTMYKEHTDIPIFTLHDCIVTTEEHAKTVKGVLLSKVDELIGFTPNVKQKTWSNRQKTTLLDVSKWCNQIIWLDFNYYKKQNKYHKKRAAL